VLRNDFIKYDDSQYISDNPRVLNGLTWANAVWAFSTGYASNWHPLTWLSHMLDVELFGLNPRGHHLTNLLFHIANTLLLLLLLNRMTERDWCSFFVAALFALHPLHVESVAWVAERKDLLSGFFFFLTLLVYTRYIEECTSAGVRPVGSSLWSGASGQRAGASRAYYAAALALFALGLMSKPMLVTVPFVLLLLDYWPLRRVEPEVGESQLKRLVPLVLEKVPFVLLTIVSCVVTFLAQRKSHSLTTELPLTLRIANAIASYLKYLGKTIWPTHLAIYYPHPNARFFSPHPEPLYPASEQWPTWAIIAAALLLISVSILILLRRRTGPWLVTGWFWYLGMLVPVIGLVQVGTQAIADRYTYLPLIGIFIAVVWGLGSLLSGPSPVPNQSVAPSSRPDGPGALKEGLASFRYPRALLATAGLMLVGVYAGITRHQLQYWRDNYTLFSHALAVTSPNAVAHFNVGARLVEQKQYRPAGAHFRAAIAADPNCEEAYAGLGYLFESLGKTNEALQQFETALRIRPWDDLSRCHIASIFEGQGRTNEALAEYKQALQFNPDNVRAHYYL